MGLHTSNIGKIQFVLDDFAKKRDVSQNTLFYNSGLFNTQSQITIAVTSIAKLIVAETKTPERAFVHTTFTNGNIFSDASTSTIHATAEAATKLFALTDDIQIFTPNTPLLESNTANKGLAQNDFSAHNLVASNDLNHLASTTKMGNLPNSLAEKYMMAMNDISKEQLLFSQKNSASDLSKNAHQTTDIHEHGSALQQVSTMIDEQMPTGTAGAGEEGNQSSASNSVFSGILGDTSNPPLRHGGFGANGQNTPKEAPMPKSSESGDDTTSTDTDSNSSNRTSSLFSGDSTHSFPTAPGLQFFSTATNSSDTSSYSENTTNTSSNFETNQHNSSTLNQPLNSTQDSTPTQIPDSTATQTPTSTDSVIQQLNLDNLSKIASVLPANTTSDPVLDQITVNNNAAMHESVNSFNPSTPTDTDMTTDPSATHAPTTTSNTTNANSSSNAATSNSSAAAPEVTVVGVDHHAAEAALAAHG